MDQRNNATEELTALPEAWKFIARVQEFMYVSGFTAERLAKSAGISSSALSQFLGNKYRGNYENVRNKLESVLQREKDRLLFRKVNPEFIETSVSLRVFEIARICRLQNEIGICYADAGTGKTESVREYAARHTDVLLIEADPGYTASVFFNELHDKLGNGGRYSLHNTFVECVRRLKGSDRLLIVDEAEQLPYKSLELIRRLHDKAGIGILLVGMPKLLGNLTGIRGEYAQLYSRVGIGARLEPLTEADVQNIIHRRIPEASDLWKVFYKETYGNTRRLFKLVIGALRIADLNKVSINVDIIATAGKLLRVEVMS